MSVNSPSRQNANEFCDEQITTGSDKTSLEMGKMFVDYFTDKCSPP